MWFSVKWQIGADTTMRNKLLKKCMEMGMPNSSILESVHPMKGKAQEEKERIAEQILARLEQKINNLEN